MSGFLFAFLAVLLVGVGARDQATVAALSVRLGASNPLLAVATACSLASAAFAAWAAQAVLPMLAGDARLVLAAMALGLAGGEMLVLGPRRAPDEPTQSLGAIGIVLLAQQVIDAARFIVFALAVGTAAPLSAGLGGAVGGAAVVAMGWAAGPLVADPRLGRLRRAVGLVLLAVAALTALAALR